MFQDRGALKREADAYMTRYVLKQSQEVDPSTGTFLNRLSSNTCPPQQDAFNMSVEYSHATDYQRMESLVRLPDPMRGMDSCMVSFKDSYMRMNEHCPLRDCILALRGGEDVVTTLVIAFRRHGFETTGTVLSAVDMTLAKNWVPYIQRYKTNNMLGILDILIRVLCTPTRSVSVRTWKTLSLLVKNTCHDNDVFLGITALEAYNIIQSLFSEAGGLMRGHYEFFSHHIVDLA